MNSYPTHIEIDLKNLLNRYYLSEMKSLYDLALDNRDSINDIRQDGLYSFLSLVSKRLLNINTVKSEALAGEIENRFDLLNEFVTSKVEQAIRNKKSFLDAVRPKQLAFINGEWKSIYKPLEKIVTVVNGQKITKYETEGVAIDIFKNRNSEYKNLIKEKAIESANKIKNVTNEQAIKVSEKVQEAYRLGKTQEQLEAELSKIIKSGEGRISLIARDQTINLAKTINSERAKTTGSTEYIWETMQDKRVRDEHRDYQGQKYNTVAGADGKGKNPGDDVNCRCWADYIF